MKSIVPLVSGVLFGDLCHAQLIVAETSYISMFQLNVHVC